MHYRMHAQAATQEDDATSTFVRAFSCLCSWRSWRSLLCSRARSVRPCSKKDWRGTAALDIHISSSHSQLVQLSVGFVTITVPAGNPRGSEKCMVWDYLWHVRVGI